ncbi:ArdC family protein [Marinobacter sp.]|uniref:ArdC family protein n=1 Tax=Marinobacter sp. TaxID=50741 RepID=UPI003562F0EC
MNKRAIDSIRDQILEALTQGRAPWQKGWKPGRGVLQPLNGKTGRQYTGWANIVSLFFSAELNAYSSPRWVTFKQAKEAGVSVKKGEKGTHVEFWKSYIPKKAKEQIESDEDEKGRKRLACKVYTVFNEDQLDGPLADAPEAETVSRNIQFVLDMAKAAGVKLAFGGGDQAYYRPGLDMVRSPNLDQYVSEEEAIATLCHEFIHWTGGKARLDRDTSCYATEELVAEAGAWLLSLELGLPFTPQNSVNYLANWASKTKDPEKALDKALSDAQKAARYLADAAKQAGLLDEAPEALPVAA